MRTRAEGHCGGGHVTRCNGSRGKVEKCRCTTDDDRLTTVYDCTTRQSCIRPSVIVSDVFAPPLWNARSPTFYNRLTNASSQGRSQKFVSEGDKTGTAGLGTEVPQRGPGQSPDGVWGRSPQKLKTYMLTTIAIMR